MNRIRSCLPSFCLWREEGKFSSARINDAMANPVCIWCLNESVDTDVEHIIPQVLGCPDDFVLPGSVVCRGCNNKLAHLDQALADEYDFSTFRARVPGRKGKLPTVRRRGNVVGTLESSGPVITINMERHSVRAHDGTIAGAYQAKGRNVDATFSVIGSAAHIKFETTFGAGPKFARGLTKVAFSFLAFFKGAEDVCAPKYDAIRKFVKLGQGNRHVMMLDCGDQKYQSGPASLHSSESNDHMVEFRIGHANYFVDLSENEPYLRSMEQSMKAVCGSIAWCVLPIEKPS